MRQYTASDARANPYRLIDRTAEQHEPALITGRRDNALLIAEWDWETIHESLYLLSVPGMRERIRDGMQTPADQLESDLDW